MFFARIIGMLVVLMIFPKPVWADSLPAYFTLDTANSSLTLSVDTGFGHFGNTVISASSGSLTATLEQTGMLPPALDLSDITGLNYLSDFTMSSVLGPVVGTGLTVYFGSTAGPFAGDGMNPGTIDLSGLSAGATTGSLNLGDTSLIDFSSSPVNSMLGSGTLAQFNEGAGPPGLELASKLPGVLQSAPRRRVGKGIDAPELAVRQAQAISAQVGRSKSSLECMSANQ